MQDSTRTQSAFAHTTATTTLRIVASLLRHAADSPTLSHFPLLSVPDQEEPVLTVLSDFTQRKSSSHPMSRTTCARTRALNSTMTPIPKNPVASERRRADALTHLTNNRSNVFQADGYQGFTSRRNSALSSTPARPSVQPTSVSASRPPRNYENPFVGCEPVAPAGGPPGDEGPGDDPGDDLNDPNFYDDDFDDDDLPPHADPTLIVLNNLAGAVSLLARNSRRANESSS